MAWLSGWAKRVKLTIDQNDVDDALSNFPILVYLSTSSGHNSNDVSFVFDELTQDANRKKIAVTTSDGETECYVEIEKWDDANEQAWLWVKVPSVASSADTDLYLYYDADHADNDAYVGDPNSTPAESVWDTNFKFVSHMQDDPDTSHIRDSTGNNNDGSKKAANVPNEVAGKIADAQDFSGYLVNEDYIDVSIVSASGAHSVAMWVYRDTASNHYIFDARLDSGIGYCYQPAAGVLTPSSGTVYADGVATTTLGTGAWHYVVVNNITLDLKSTMRLALRFVPSGDYCLDGKEDEVRISNTARTVAWIKASYESERDDLLDWGSEELAVVAKPFSHGYIIE